MIHYPNILLVAGSGRNVGKSSLVVALLQKFREISPLAIKITPHFHNLPDEKALLIKDEHFVISTEQNIHTDKDTSRFLRAGAQAVYFIQSYDEFLEKAFIKLMDILGDKNYPIIIESGGLRNVVKPGLFVFVETENNETKDLTIKTKADTIVSLKTDSFKELLKQIKWENAIWKLRLL